MTETRAAGRPDLGQTSPSSRPTRKSGKLCSAGSERGEFAALAQLQERGKSAPCRVAATSRLLRHSWTLNIAFQPRSRSRSPRTELSEEEVFMEGQNERPKSPGLKWRKRKTGPPVPYWFACEKAVGAGYPVKSANLSS